MSVDLDPDRFESLRPDANRFILGVVWLSAIGVLTLNSASILSAAHFIDDAAAALAHVNVPPFVIGFLAVLAGVVLPYCLAVTFMPISILAANVVLRLHRKLEKESSEPLSREAMTAVRTDLSINTNIGFSGLELYLLLRSPRLGKVMDRRSDHLYFRAYATLPASILLTWLIFHLLITSLVPAVAYFLAGLIGLAAFGLAAYQNNNQLSELVADTQRAALLAAKSHAKPSSNP